MRMRAVLVSRRCGVVIRLGEKGTEGLRTVLFFGRITSCESFLPLSLPLPSHLSLRVYIHTLVDALLTNMVWMGHRRRLRSMHLPRPPPAPLKTNGGLAHARGPREDIEMVVLCAGVGGFDFVCERESSSLSFSLVHQHSHSRLKFALITYLSSDFLPSLWSDLDLDREY